MENNFSSIEDLYKDLVVKVLSDKATATEINLLKDWIGQNERNKAYYNQMKNIWRLSSTLQSGKFDVEAGWQKASETINERSPKIRFRLNPVAIAAIWIAAFLLGGALTFLVYRNNPQKEPIPSYSENEIRAPKGSKSELVLPDGTLVWLNAGSKIRYQQSYNTTHREVYLEGEAYFKVKTNPQKPFIVKTSDVSVKAYGTAFNVKAYPEEGTITTTLEEGHIKIAGTNKNSKEFEVSLKPNQKFTYTKKTYSTSIASVSDSLDTTDEARVKMKETIAPISIDNVKETKLYTSWKDFNWYIEREDLDKLVVILERRYNVVFDCKSDELKKYKVSGTIRNETIEQVLDFLKLTVPLKYKIKDGIVTIDIDRNRSDNYLKIMNN